MPQNKEVMLTRFGAATALLFPGNGGSVEIAMAPLEMIRILEAWESYEEAKKKPDHKVLEALRFLGSKARQQSPRIRAEVPISACSRAALTPDTVRNSLELKWFER